ncbi:hypothetical protein [Pseudoalteromonas fuliginea]|uniref:Uncharacterized protein n=2 Tax=Pseudoalteromonas fuliginea TaxID=1872678 RepID=A0ABQ6RH14_9GAMM|nr:hypothetical protein [Pseudoalteromonas fuliginea]KAA1154377.1 hypothetical protein EU509_12875 [Pseudoalteromonas fuliginea]KAA1166977.1 hypothetical protein EUZ79_12865 [Pseudoalteromonas fuliginea]
MKYSLLFVAILSFDAFADLNVELANKSEKEQLKYSQLKRVEKTYDLGKWQFTDSVVIDEFAKRPHSHPKLTLTVSMPKNDGAFLSQYLHEQIHWFEDSRKTEVQNVINDLKIKYPDAPKKGPEGARSELSTYLHLAVCLLEYDALTEILGEEEAHKIISTNSKYFYKWIYQKTLTEPDSIRDILVKHNLYIK